MKGLVNFILVAIVAIIVWAIVVNVNATGVSAPIGIFLAFMIIFVPAIFYALTNEKVDETIDKFQIDKREKKDDRILNTKIQGSILEYVEYKSKIKNYTNEQLQVEYIFMQESNLQNLERLALEEELKNRKLINDTPLKDKLDKLNDLFNNS